MEEILEMLHPNLKKVARWENCWERLLRCSIVNALESWKLELFGGGHRITLYCASTKYPSLLYWSLGILAVAHIYRAFAAQKNIIPKLLQFKWPLALPTLRESMLLAPYLAQLHQGTRGWTNRSVPVVSAGVKKKQMIWKAFSNKEKTWMELLHQPAAWRKGFAPQIFQLECTCVHSN